MSTENPTQEPAKRGRGRPRKAATVTEEVVAPVVQAQAEPAAPADKPKRKRGRPRKTAEVVSPVVEEEAPVDDSFLYSFDNDEEEQPTAAAKPKRRGRPKKNPEPTPVEVLDLDDDHDDLSLDDDDDLDSIDDLDDDDLLGGDIVSDSPKRARSSATAEKIEITVQKEVVKRPELVVNRVESSIDPVTFQATSSTLEQIGLTPYPLKKDEEYMNQPQKLHIKEILQRQRADLVNSLENTKEIMREEGGNYADEIDMAEQEAEFAVSLRNRDRERRLIAKIDTTLSRLANDLDFGYCDECGDEIGLRRLEARPTATLCITCKSRAEIHERQRRG